MYGGQQVHPLEVLYLAQLEFINTFAEAIMYHCDFCSHEYMKHPHCSVIAVQPRLQNSWDAVWNIRETECNLLLSYQQLFFTKCSWAHVVI